MRAVFHTNQPAPWGDQLPSNPWPLLPLGGQPMILTWVESAHAVGIEEILIVLGVGAAGVENLCGDGTRWGCTITYTFTDPTDAEQSAGPHVRGPAIVLPGEADLEIRLLTTLNDLYQANLDLAAGRVRLAVRSGYQSVEGEAVGLNVVLSPSCQCHRPLVLGDHVRLGSFCEIGPETVLSNHVVVGRGSRVVRSLVLDHTYIGDGLNVDGKIVAGNQIIDPEDGTSLALDDLLLSDLRRSSGIGDWVGSLAGRLTALALLALLIVPWVLLRLTSPRREPIQILDRNNGVLALSPRSERGLFHRLGLDRVPRLWLVLAGRFALCGHEPFLASESELAEELYRPRPAAFVLNETDDATLKLFDARIAQVERSTRFAFRTLTTWFGTRLRGRSTGTTGVVP